MNSAKGCRSVQRNGGAETTLMTASKPDTPPNSSTEDGVLQTTVTSPETAGIYGFRSLTLMVIASMIGAGVFTTSGFTLGVVQTPGVVLLCWCLGGLLAICGAIGYGQLAALLPQSGGEYLYLSRNVHPCAGFLAGWISLTAGFSGAIATAAVAFERYAVPAELRPNWLPADSMAVLAIVLCGVLHGIHPATGKWFQNGVVLIKLAAMTVFLAVVAVRLPTHPWHFEGTGADSLTGMDLVSAVAVSLVWISLSYAGFNAAIYVASESRAAAKSVPGALLAGTIAVTALYLILNAIFVLATPAEDVVWQEAVAAIAARSIGGPSLDALIRMAVALGLLSSVSAMVVAGPRVYSQMADDGVFPSLFRAASGGIARSVALQTVIAVGLIVVQSLLVRAGLIRSSLLGLLMYLGTTLSVSSAICVGTLFLPSVRRQLKTSSLLRDTAVSVYVLGTLGSVVILMCTHEVDGQSQGLHHMAGAALTIVSGLLAWTVFRRRKTVDAA